MAQSRAPIGPDSGAEVSLGVVGCRWVSLGVTWGGLGGAMPEKHRRVLRSTIEEIRSIVSRGLAEG